MFTKVMFVVAAGLALLTIVYPANAVISVSAVAALCCTAVLAAIEAARAGRFLWVSGFIAMATLVNPILPVATRGAVVALLGVSLAILASWMIVLSRTIPRQTIAQVLHPQDPR